jgi:nucleoside phosphorylase
MKPFSIEVRIDGRLQGEKNKKFHFRRPTEPGNIPNLSSIVTPCGTPDFQLDDIASKLDHEMTTLNIEKYRSEAKMLLQHQDPVSPRPTFCIERRDRGSISHSDDSQQPRPRSEYNHSDYTVAWICALPIEMAAAKAMLEETHPNLPVHHSDTNHYVLGQIGSHKIVLACLPHDAYGTTSAAVVATHMLYTFNHIRMGLMVGIGGGVPSATNDIRLGDVVVSSPTRLFGGVIQHDMGKNVGHKIQMTGALNRPPQSLLVAVARLRTEHLISGNKVPDYVEEMLTKNPTMKSDFSCLGPDRDRLFEANYDHIESKAACEKCDQDREIVRPPRAVKGPNIHYGLIASGNQVMRHGLTRDRLAEDLDILCFEMEAAGLMNNFPCLVVRGICDYADSHKSKEWQGYAAATAAGYAKNLLSVISVPQIYSIPVAVTSVSGGRV